MSVKVSPTNVLLLGVLGVLVYIATRPPPPPVVIQQGGGGGGLVDQAIGLARKIF